MMLLSYILQATRKYWTSSASLGFDHCIIFFLHNFSPFLSFCLLIVFTQPHNILLYLLFGLYIVLVYEDREQQHRHLMDPQGWDRPTIEEEMIQRYLIDLK